jgi:hypothetical protein
MSNGSLEVKIAHRLNQLKRSIPATRKRLLDGLTLALMIVLLTT